MFVLSEGHSFSSGRPRRRGNPRARSRLTLIHHFRFSTSRCKRHHPPLSLSALPNLNGVQKSTACAPIPRPMPRQALSDRPTSLQSPRPVTLTIELHLCHRIQGIAPPHQPSPRGAPRIGHVTSGRRLQHHIRNPDPLNRTTEEARSQLPRAE